MHRWFLFFALVGCGASTVRDVAPQEVVHTTSGRALDLPALDPVETNPQRQSAIELGRALFYDARLSVTGTVSCATCHEQGRGFADGEVLSRRGVSGHLLARHAPVLVNLAWATRGLFWDGGAKNLESQVLAPIVAPHEMGASLSDVVRTVQSDLSYVKAFKTAFGDDVVSTSHIAQALAQFIRSMVSVNSRYDQYVRGEPEGALDAQEYEGLQVFDRSCRACHATDLFTDHNFHNNGLDAVFLDGDEGVHLGRARITQAPADVGKFKTPTLRNVAVSAPYMHDGRFASLEDVVEHYRRGVQRSETLDAALIRPDGQVGVAMTDTEAAALLAFLATLTDEDFLSSAQLAKKVLP